MEEGGMNMISVMGLMQRVNMREVDKDESKTKLTPLAWSGVRSGQPLRGVRIATTRMERH